MNKQDWVWVAIRVFGIYLIILGLSNIPWLYMDYVTFTPNISKVLGMGNPDSESCIRLAEQATLISTIKLLNSFLKVSLYTGIGFYFIRNGKGFFKLIH